MIRALFIRYISPLLAHIFPRFIGAEEKGNGVSDENGTQDICLQGAAQLESLHLKLGIRSKYL